MRISKVIHTYIGLYILLGIFSENLSACDTCHYWICVEIYRTMEKLQNNSDNNWDQLYGRFEGLEYALDVMKKNGHKSQTYLNEVLK